MAWPDLDLFAICLYRASPPVAYAISGDLFNADADAAGANGVGAHEDRPASDANKAFSHTATVPYPHPCSHDHVHFWTI